MNAGSVENLHRNVATVIRAVTTIPCRIRAQQTVAANDVTYGLVAAENMAPLELVDRIRGGRAAVVPLFPIEDVTQPTVWMSWFEKWLRDGTQLKIKSVSATLYWGVAFRPRTQLLRAEWDAADRSPATAAQPHWQVDTELTGEFYRTAAPQPQSSPTTDSLVELPPNDTSGELVEIAVEGLLQISLSRLHLGMAGWQNTTAHPSCWQHDIGTSGVALELWADRTIRHAADQFKVLSVASV